MEVLRVCWRLVACYLFGLIVGSILFSIFGSGVALFLPFVVVGAIEALPLLAVALVVLLVFRRNISKYLLYWCLAAPFAVTIAWLVMEYYLRRGYDMAGFLAIQNVQGRALLAFLCAWLASVRFYRWHGQHPGPYVMAKLQRHANEASDRA